MGLIVIRTLQAETEIPASGRRGRTQWTLRLCLSQPKWPSESSSSVLWEKSYAMAVAAAREVN